MTLWTLGMGTSSSLVATAIVYWIIERNLVHALVIGGTGVVVFILTLIFTKKPSAQPTVHQENKQEFKPHTEFHQPISVVVGGNAAAPAPALAPEREPEPRCNIQFTGVGLGKLEQTHALSKYAGQIIEYAGAGFENKAIQGGKLRVPLVRARLIFRHPDGHTIADVSNAAWIRPPSDFASPYMKLQVNTVEYVVLFWLVGGQLTCQSVIPDNYIRINRRSRPTVRTHELNGNIGTVEIQLLTETEHLRSVLLRFRDDDDNALPVFTGVAEPAE